ncbi:kinase-like domain-containing protein [Rhizophagus irregularis DAOM 181602=DAOM 197198]|nr:kinase-like domain-containing protein [Rhizophagus irregularis DAOM 181602=DAOM 197198]
MTDNTAYECYHQLSNKRQLIQNLDMLSHITRNFFRINISEIEPTTQDIEYIFDDDLNIVIDNLINLYFQETNKGKEEKVRKKFVLDYFNYYKINLQKMYYWLLNNQTCSNTVYLLGYFNYHGIEIDIDEQNAFELYQKAAELGYCYEYGIGTNVNGQKAFELYQKAAELGNVIGIYNLGRCYKNGFGTTINKNKAFESLLKAVNLGYNVAQQNIAWMYEKGYGTEKNMDLAIYWYKKSAEQGNKYSQNKLNKLLNE